MGAVVIPLRPFENALRQAARMPVPVPRKFCIREVLAELQAGRNGSAVAGELQRARFSEAHAPGGAA